ncbi:MAG: CRISPR-associated CARF protein Csa3 [Thermofilum sp.]
MGRTFIASLGFDQSTIVRLIGERGLSDGDSLWIITSSTPHPRAESALQSIREFVSKINPKVKVEVLRLDEKNLIENVAALARLIEESENPIVDASGGPRIIALSLFLAACFSGVTVVYMTTETTGERIEIPVPVIPRRALSSRQAEVLALLPARVSELAHELKLSKPTVSRILRSLVSKGLARRRPDRVFEPTLTGAILKRLHTIRAGSSPGPGTRTGGP